MILPPETETTLTPCNTASTSRLPIPVRNSIFDNSVGGRLICPWAMSSPVKVMIVPSGKFGVNAFAMLIRAGTVGSSLAVGTNGSPFPSSAHTPRYRRPPPAPLPDAILHLLCLRVAVALDDERAAELDTF